MTTHAATSETKKERQSSHQKGNFFSKAAAPDVSITHLDTPVSTANKQAEKEVPPKRSHFTQLPNSIIDSDVSESCLAGFVRFLRHFGRAGVFTGSIRKLCKILKMARATVTKIVDQWVTAGWIIRTTRPKQYEDGEVMCLIVLGEDLWKHNSEHYKKPDGSHVSQDVEEFGPEDDGEAPGDSPDNQGGSHVSQGGSNLGQGGTEVNQGGANLGQSGPNVGQSGSSPTLKTGGNIDSNMDSNTESNMDRNMGDTRKTDELPKVDPPSLPALPSQNSFLSIDEITSETPHSWQAIMAIGVHYLGRGKCTQADAEALVQKTQAYANLVGAHEARRQIITNITFMVYSTAPGNWYQGEKRKALNLRAVATHHEDYTRKAQESGWEPPADKAPAWFNGEEASPKADASEETWSPGMTQSEMETLATLIWSQYPGMPLEYEQISDTEEAYAVYLHLGARRSWPLLRINDWRQPDARGQAKIAQAVEQWQRSRELEVA